MALNIDQAMQAIDSAYQLICEFQITIDNLEGDHPMANAVELWLDWYEKQTGNSINLQGATIEGYPV